MVGCLFIDDCDLCESVVCTDASYVRKIRYFFIYIFQYISIINRELSGQPKVKSYPTPGW